MEFQPVVMAAGRGSRMTDLTSQCPKAMLPIGNKPMLWYPINTLERAGFEEAIVIVLESFSMEAQKSLHDLCGVRMRLEFISIPDNDSWGTADALRYIKDKIKKDILVISCDLITDLSLHQIANVHRTYDSTVTMLLSTVSEQYAEIPVPGVKTKKRTERDFIGFDEKGDRVLFLTSEADLEETVSFRKSLLKKHPRINIHSGLTDCHLYLMKKWVVDFLAENKAISSMKGELLPYLVKKQFSKPKTHERDLPQANASIISDDVKADINSFAPEDKMDKLVKEMSTWIDHVGDMADCFHGDRIRCYAYIQDGGFCVRTNTLGTFCEANKQISRLLPTLAPNMEVCATHPTTTIKEKSQVGSDCLVDEGVTIGEKVSVKRSVIGKHCSIGDRVKVTNCVILDHVTILEGCNIQGSVIGSNAQIGEKCELKDCIVGNSQSIIAMGKLTNEAIVNINEMMEI